MLSPERLQWIDAAMKGASKIRNENILLEVWCKGETLQPGRMHQRTPNAEWRKCVSAIVRRRNFAATRGTPPKPERAKFGGEAWFVWSGLFGENYVKLLALQNHDFKWENKQNLLTWRSVFLIYHKMIFQLFWVSPKMSNFKTCSPKFSGRFQAF